MLLQQAGLLDHALQKFVRESSHNPCSIQSKNGSNKKGQSNSDSSKLKDFSGAFIILGVGLGFAVATLVGEIVAKKIFRRH